MGRYRAADLLLPPSLVSFCRVPLAVAFPFVVTTPWLAMAVLAAAGLSDVLDGYLARRFRQATPTGAVVDGMTDKLFVLSVVVTLLVTTHLPPWSVLLLGARELGEAPLVLWWAFSPPQRRTRAADPKANVMGKAATVAQFAAVAAALLASPQRDTLLLLTGVLGTIAAASYWRRELKRRRRNGG